jgi:hypothetical protein
LVIKNSMYFADHNPHCTYRLPFKHNEKGPCNSNECTAQMMTKKVE